MGFFQNAFGDNRVLTSKNPEIQKMLTYMDQKYDANIIEYKEKRGNWCVIRCGSDKYFDFLYHKGYLQNGSLYVPGMGQVFRSKTEAFEGLLWLYDLLEEQERNKRRDEELF